jgi:hypothetical protein
MSLSIRFTHAVPYAWIDGCVPVSSHDEPCSVPLDLPFFRFDKPLVGISLLLISEDTIYFNYFIFRPTLLLRSDTSFLRLTMSPLIFVRESVTSLTSSFSVDY